MGDEDFINEATYTGAVYDEETGLYYMNARYYEPETGRFISQDTRGTGEAFWHLYLYCNSDPVNFTDPTGQYAASLTLSSSLIAALSKALPGIISGIAVAMASIKAAIATSWVPAVCLAAVAVAIVGITYTVKKVSALNARATTTRAAVQTKVKAGGVNRKKLGNNTVYVIVRKGTSDVVYVGRTCNYKAREASHTKTRFPKSSYTMYAIATKLTLAQARALEQTIITAYGIDTLKNMINSISPSKWSYFKQEFKQMQTLIQSYADPE